MQSESNSREANSPSDPWSWDAFSPASAPSGAPVAPAPTKRQRKAIPAQDELFTVQKDLLKALNELEELEHGSPGVNTRRLRQQLQNGYRVLNRYLRSHAQ